MKASGGARTGRRNTRTWAPAAKHPQTSYLYHNATEAKGRRPVRDNDFVDNDKVHS